MINKKPNEGFTLVEVLIALAILAISLTALVKASSSDIENTTFLQNKALAHLVGQEAITLIKLNAIGFNGNETDQETLLAGKNWHWHAEKTPTSIKSIQKINITVFDDKKPISYQTGYLLELNDAA